MYCCQVAVPDIPSPNPLYPVMSDAVTFKYAENRGRYAVASKVMNITFAVNIQS